jgi:hypothetical protein
MRYSTRWSNGFWKTFDSLAFADVAIHSRAVDANVAVDRLNGRQAR